MDKLRSKSLEKNTSYARRKQRTNVTIKTTATKPRLLVIRSNVHIRAQIIGVDGNVLVTAHDLTATSGTKSERAFAV